jgi:micrococcal nuclease
MAWRECVRRPAGLPRAAFGLVVGLALVGVSAHLAPAGAQTLFGAVVRVVDGDTIHVQLGDRVEKVRYIGMNTPETHHPTRAEEPGGREAKPRFNRQLVDGQRARLELDAQVRDQYGRLLAYVWVGNVMVNAELVRRGYAQVMTIPPNVKHAELFVRLQREAREARRGLWGGH